MNEKKVAQDAFEASRAHLRAVAYRMLGSLSEAEDAVQEAWLRLARNDPGTIDNLSGWLTTVVARICLDMLRRRKARKEDELGTEPQAAASQAPSISPEDEMAMADSVGVALLVVLERLQPAERLAFVLHDLFAVPYEDIAAILERNPEATRQLASRARRRVRAPQDEIIPGRTERRQVVEAFLAASREGNFAALLSMLDPDAMFSADEFAARIGVLPEIRGADAVAGAFNGRAAAARPALIDGAPAILVAPRGRLLFVFLLSFRDGRISRVEAVADPERIAGLEITVPEA